MSVTSGTKSESGLGETIRVVIHALLIALVIRTFLFQPFNIPSGSMKATLLVGDYLFVSKYSYGYSHYSIPLSLPLFSGRIFASEPARGDIVVFRQPKDDSVDFIKRVIGLPGDRIRCATVCSTSTTRRSNASASPISSAKMPAAASTITRGG
jgi:signal peptidase I